MTSPRKILLTGALGALGSALREPLSDMAETLLSVDIKDAPDATFANETFVQADVADMDQVKPLVKGITHIVHFAGIADERTFEELLGPNFLSCYNIWEAGYRAGVKRIVYASSVHAVGMYPSAEGIDLTAPHRPDSFYGVAKCFAENLGQMYWEKCGLESVHLRIFSCTPKPANVRALGTWLSRPDLVRLVQRSIDSPTVGFRTVFGISNNDRAPVSNTQAAALGYRPQDNAEDYAADLLANAPEADPTDLAQTCLGGPFATVPLGESGVAAIKKMGKS